MKKSVSAHKDFSFFVTPSDLRQIGLNEVAYIKRYDVNGQPAFVVHAADGTAIAVQKDISSALGSAHHQDLDVVALH